jgi:hypothetical protein
MIALPQITSRDFVPMAEHYSATLRVGSNATRNRYPERRYGPTGSVIVQSLAILRLCRQPDGNLRSSNQLLIHEVQRQRVSGSSNIQSDWLEMDCDAR